MKPGIRGLARSGRIWLWGLPAAVWLVFCFWYANTAGPLSAEEIAAFTAEAERLGRSPDGVRSLGQFMAEDSGRQFLMVNLIDMAAPNSARELSPQESLDRYMAHMYPELLRRACHPVLAGPAVFRAMDGAGIEDAEEWSSVGIMRYRSRRDLMEIALNPIFDGKHEFKIAALEKTIAVPIEPNLYLGDLRLVAFFGLFLPIVIADALIFRRRPRTPA